MIDVNFIPNPFSQEGREGVRVDFRRNMPLESYLKESGFAYQQMRIVVSGRRVDDLNAIIEDGDEILILPGIEFDPGTWAVLVAVFKTIATIATYAAFAYSIYQAVTYRKPSMPNYGSNDESSPTYGWDGVQTIQEVGTPVPVIYGEHIVGGNIVNSFVATDGDQNYLNVLLALCEGEIESVSDLKINDNPAANFDGIETAVRLGTNADMVIPNFNDLHNLYPQSQNLTQNNPYVYTTVMTDVEAFELHLTFSGGLYQQNQSNGSLETWDVTYRVEYKPHNEPVYTDLGLITVSAKSRTAVRRVFRKEGLSPGQYDIRITRTSEDSSTYKMGDLSLSNVDEIKTDDLAYPNTAKLGIRALATDQLSGAMPNFTCIVRGKKVLVPRIMYDGSEVPWQDYYWDPEDEVYKRFSDNAECYWDGTTYVERWSANPVWCLKDLLLSSRYGLGEFLDINNIDVGLFLEMSRYCEEKVEDGDEGYEKRFRMDVVIDSPARVPDILTQLAGVFRGLIFFSEGAVKVRVDKPELPVQLFGMGNIIEGGFSQQWKSLRDLPNVVEVEFLDKDKNYQREKIAVVDEEALANGEPMRAKSVKVFVTKMSYALREGRYVLKASRYVNRSISLKCGIDAVVCQAGDLINISHDVPQWGFSGRVKSGSINSVGLDQPLTIEEGKTYKVQVRFHDDVIEERTVTSPAGERTTLTVSPAFSTIPQEYDVYAFGETGKVVRPFRVMTLTVNNNDEVEIAATEYNENVYDDSAVVIPSDNYSSLSTDIPVVENFDLTERAVTLADGTIENLIDVYFNYPDDTRHINKYKGCKLYLSDDGGNSYYLVAYTEAREYAISGNIQKGKTYYVKAVTVTHNGIEDSLNNAPTDSVYIVGKDVEPDIVSNFQWTWGGNILTLVWSPNIEPDLAGYEIRKNDLNFGVDDGDLVYRGLATKFVLEPGGRSDGTYYLRAYNTSGLYSSHSASVVPVNAVPSQPTGLNADVFFNVARVWWEDAADTDVLKYEVWKSETGDWSGEEEKVAEVSGRSVMVDGKKARGGDVSGSTNNTLVSDSLIGLDDDILLGDVVLITSGDNQGQESRIIDFDGETGTITIDGTWEINPVAGDTFIIFDSFQIKVRGRDHYGAGSFSSALSVTFEGLDENALGDNVITARKIYVACLSALTSNVGCLTAGIIQGVTFQTGAGGARTVFDSTMFRSYDSACNVMFEVHDGCVCAKTLKLVDPNCDCCYSYLSAGQWYFHDALGNVTPYVKRIDSGVACTGSMICLAGWCTQPRVLAGINKLNSYDKNYSAQTQQWDVYSTTPVFYCNSSVDYGYCFSVHARLMLAASVGASCLRDIGFGICYLSAANTCSVCVRHRFQLWCNAACANYFAGCLCYDICYRVNGCLTWCKCSYTYLQPYANVSQLKSTQDKYDVLNLPSGQCWQLMSCQTGVSWVNTGISSATCCNCTVSVAQTSPGGLLEGFCNCYIGGSYGCIKSGSFSIADSWSPLCDGTWTAYCTINGPAAYYCGVVRARLCNGQYSYPQAYYDCTSFGAMCICTCAPGVVCCSSGSGTGIRIGYWRMVNCVNAPSAGCMCSSWCVCLCNCTRTVCYCKMFCSGSADYCAYMNIYTTQDTYATSCILDPTGCLNWLAIGYF